MIGYGTWIIMLLFWILKVGNSNENTKKTHLSCCELLLWISLSIYFSFNWQKAGNFKMIFPVLNGLSYMFGIKPVSCLIFSSDIFVTYEVDYVYLHVIYLVPYIDFLSDRQVLCWWYFMAGEKWKAKMNFLSYGKILQLT